ncbi:AraC family transcriptional regulator [Mucilaginibacter sp. SG564]|uniref:helix-turn-helix domain-containing protein n=1 Tax=unclassified Mucilaginibacter TaxID=2617802 RepID=UPI00155437B9|nr:AraC family transcriptional regulator [Mucilaginibacter sp. SG564]NOW95770.1 AraC-like DNA-binding protein [Mucilaginibacter sp. SG564]
MATTPVPKKILARQHEITADFLKALDRHLDDLLQHKVLDMMEIRDFAGQLHIHPTHLSNTIKLTTGRAPCDFFEERIMKIAKDMLRSSNISVAEIAAELTFDPSNFTKFFKRFEGVTPKQYREQVLIKQYEQVD